MNQIDLAALDLNLLVVLDLLLEERSVSRAAARLGRSQSAVSHALGRLREQLDDPLLVRTGRGMLPSPRALELQAPLRETLEGLQGLLGRPRAFDASSSRRRFLLASPDILAVLLPELLARLQAEAPGVQLELAPPPANAAEALGAELDLCLAPLPEGGGALRVRRLGVLRNAVAMRSGHPAVEDWGLEAYLAWPHAYVRTASAGPSVVARALAARGLERRVGAVLPGFLQALMVVARTDQLFTCPSALVGPVEALLGLQTRPLPIDIPPVPVVALWHARKDADPGHRWFRERVARVLSGWLG